MPMLLSDLSRKFFLDVTASGHVFIRERGFQRRDGALPTFSTETYDEAEMLVMRFCRRANDGSGLYFLNEPPVDLDALGNVSDMFRIEHGRRSVRKAGGAMGNYQPATDEEILAALQPNIGMQTTTVARSILSTRGVTRLPPDERGRQSGNDRSFISYVANALRRLGGIQNTSTIERADPRVVLRGRKWTITRAGMALRDARADPHLAEGEAVKKIRMFTMKGCAPCAAVKRILNADPSLAAKVEIVDIDTAKGERLADEHHVRALPTFLRGDGKGKNRHLGAMSKRELLAWIEGAP